jgi:TP901 family phage tail tape measure protein/lambda family phage tail tape measure protein
MAVSPQTLLFVLKVQDEASRAFQGAGLAVASLGFAFGAAAAAAVKASVDFNRALTQMQTLANVSASEIDGVSQALRDMAIETGRGPQDLAEAMYFVSSSGFQTKEAMDVVRASAQGAAVGLGDTKTVADAVTSAMNAYGHENLSAADAVGTLVEAVKMGKGEADQIASAIGRVIGVSAQMGVSFKDVTGATAAMTTTGLTAAQSVTAIRQTLLAMYAPTMQARRVLHSLGVDYHDLQNVFKEKGFLEGIENLKRVAGTEVNLRMILGDKEAVNAIFGLLGANLEHTKQIMADMGKAGHDSLQEAFRIAAGSNAFTWAQGVALLKVALLDFGNAVMPLVIRVIHVAIEVFFTLKAGVTAVTTAWHEHRVAMIAALTAVTAFMIISILPGILTSLAATIAITTVRMVALRAAMASVSVASLGTLFTSLAGSIVMLGEAALAAIPEVIALAAALWATGIPELIIGITALVTALIWFTNHMFETADGVVSGWEIIKATWAGAVAFTKEVWNEIGDTVISTERAILAVATLGFSEVVIAIYQHWEEIKADVAAAWPFIVEAVKQGILAVLEAIPLLGPMITLIASYWDSILRGAQAAWRAIKDTVKSYISDILALVPGVTLAIAGAGAIAHSKAGQAAGSAYQSTLQGFAAARPFRIPGARSGKLDLSAPTAGELADQYGSPAGAPPAPSGVADYAPGGKHGAKKGSTEKSPAEKELEATNKVIEALKVQAAAYSESASQHEYLDAVRRAGLNSLTIEQKTLEQGLGITDAQAKSSAHLNNIREIARAVQVKMTAEHQEWLRDLTLDADEQAKLVEAHRLGIREAYIETAVINAQTEAIKAHKKFTDEDAAAVRHRATATFDAGKEMKEVDDVRSFNLAIGALQREAQAFGMVDRARAIYLAGEQARHRAAEQHDADVDGQVQRAQQLAAAEFDLQHHALTASEGVYKFMSEAQANAITTGTIIYNALGAAYQGLSNALWNFISGQKVGWRQLAFEVVSQIGKMIVQMLVMKAVMASLRFMGFSTGGLFGTGDVLGGGATFAKGGQFTPFASGGPFTNTIVDKMTAFAFHENGRRQLGIMGEAGPEAIMPLIRSGQAMAVAAWTRDGVRKALDLTRGPDGALGVRLPERFAYGGVIGSNDNLRSMRRGGGMGDGHVFMEGDTHISMPIELHYTPTGDPKYDRKHAEQVAQMVKGTIDERIGLAVRQMERKGGRMNTFGMKGR